MGDGIGDGLDDVAAGPQLFSRDEVLLLMARGAVAMEQHRRELADDGLRFTAAAGEALLVGVLDAYEAQRG